MASLAQSVTISDGDRLSFTIFVALALHALALFHDFLPEDTKPAPFSMEITLSRYEDDKKPEQADFLAQTNQQGGGSEEDKSRVTSPVQAKQVHNVAQHASSPAPKIDNQQLNEKQVVSSVNSKTPRPSLFDRVMEDSKPAQIQPRKSILERSLEIAELEADLDRQQRNYAKRARVTRLTAASTMKAVDSQYVAHVIKKIERVGSKHYPQRAKSVLLKMKRPRLSISIYSDGTIRNIEVLESSGDLVLDSQTVNNVYRAEPFAPFPKEVRKEWDVIELIRTFSYQNGGVSSY